MEVNSDTCEVFRIHRKKKPVIFPYILHDTTPRTTENVKFLGVTISSSKSGLLLNNAEIKPVSQCYTKYIIHNKQVNVDHSHLTTTRNNKFLIPHPKTKHHMNSFLPRAIRLWNKLPTVIKDAPTVPAFASGLNMFYAFN